MTAPAVLGLAIMGLGVALVLVMLAAFGWGDSPFAWYTA